MLMPGLIRWWNKDYIVTTTTWQGTEYEYGVEHIDFAMKYHGISCATFCEICERWIFHRNGERCFLFTEQVREAIRRRNENLHNK